MISINFTGATIEEIAGQALHFLMKLPGVSVAAKPTPGGGVSLPAGSPAIVNEPIAQAAVDKAEAEAEAEEAAASESERLNAKLRGVYRRGRRTRAEMEAARAAETAAQADAPAPTFETLKSELRLVCETDNCGVDGARGLLEAFEAKRLSDIPEARWPEFVAAARAKIAAAK